MDLSNPERRTTTRSFIEAFDRYLQQSNPVVLLPIYLPIPIMFDPFRMPVPGPGMLAPLAAISEWQNHGGALATAGKRTPFGITPPEFQKLLQDSTLHIEATLTLPKDLLILDFRKPEAYQVRRVNHGNCVNIALPDGINVQLETRRDVIRFFMQLCPHLLDKLYSPGQYNNVVIMDEKSFSDNISSALKTMRVAMMKWNLESSTRIHVLEGGLRLFEHLCPRNIVLSSIPSSNIISTEVFTHSTPTSTTTTTTTTVVALPPQNAQGLSLEVQEIIKGLYSHIDYLDAELVTTHKLIGERGKLRSLEGIRKSLHREQEVILQSRLELQVPDEAKCPVCTEMYVGEIFQCGNGHSFCARCAQKLRQCAECRLPFAKGPTLPLGMVRNRALENLMEHHGLHVKCLCTETVGCRQIPGHVRRCANRRKMEEVLRLEAEMGRTTEKIAKLGEKLEEMNNFIADLEQYWNSQAALNRGQNMLPDEYKAVVERIYRRKMALAAAKATLMSSMLIEPMETNFSSRR